MTKYLKKRLILRLITIIFLTLGLWFIGSATWIHAKAMLAQVLIKDAWEHSIVTKQFVKPWDWADTWPVAKLSWSTDSREESFYVLNGSHGHSLAFGPGWLTQSALPGYQGTTIIAAHNDTHFRSLKNISVGDHIRLDDINNQQHIYTVDNIDIINIEESALYIADDSTPKIKLITCYPFNAIASNTKQRYIIEGILIEPSSLVSVDRGSSIEL